MDSGVHVARTEPVGLHASHSHRARKRPRGRWLILLLAGALVGGGALYTVATAVRTPPTPGCPTRTVRLVATAEIAPVLRAQVAAAECTTLKISAAPPDEVSRRLDAGKQPADLWIPDSSVWTLDRPDGAVETVERSLAISPVVMVGQGQVPSSWSQLVAGDDFVMGDPIGGADAGVPLIGTLLEGRALHDKEAAIARRIVRAAQDSLSRDQPPEVAARLQRVAAGQGTTVASEQQVLSHDVGGAPLTIGVPRIGTALLDYPVLVTAAKAARSSARDAGRWLVQLLESDRGQRALRQARFRTSLSDSPKGGLETIEQFDMGSNGSLWAAQALWRTLAMPSRALVVFDVSGSMNFAAGDQTRMDLVIETALAGLELFPDAAALGVWAFSQRLGTHGRDYRELAPVRPLGAQVGEGDQRALLRTTARRLGRLTGGGTGLYDTTLAAYQQMREQYDPRAVNSVILLTDGTNDDRGSISRRALLAKLRRLHDPGRPVKVVAIGISKDADASALRAIARATGGSAFVARDPHDIAGVFTQAMSERQKAS